MMKVLTSHEIREVRRWLTNNGIACSITPRSNSMVLELKWRKNRVWGNGVNGFEMATFLIKEICSGIGIEFVRGSEVGNVCSAVLNVGYRG